LGRHGGLRPNDGGTGLRRLREEVVMVDAAYLKVNRTASRLRAKKGGAGD
jgi:hypothetical protein